MKLVMGLIGLFPDDRMVMTLLVVVLVGLVAVLITLEGRAGLRRLFALLSTAASGALPTREEIKEAYQARPSRITFLIGLAGVVYLWTRQTGL